MTLTHDLLIQNNRAEYRRFVRLYANVRKSKISTPHEMVEVVHRNDRKCCEAEVWEETVKRLCSRIESTTRRWRTRQEPR